MNENQTKKLKVWIICIIWIISVITGFGFFTFSAITHKYDLFASILIFNGIAMTFIVIIFIFSLIEIISIEGEFKNGFYGAYILDLITCVIGAATIISIFGSQNFTGHIILEFLYIFFIYYAISGGLSMLIGISLIY